MEWIDQFVEMIFPLDRRKMNIEGAFMLKHHHLPKSIFKYRELNTCSLRNLQEDTVWLSDPSNFNDPYDCAHTMDQDALSRVLAKEYLPQFFKEKGLQDQLGKEVLEKILQSDDSIISFMDAMLSKEPEENREGIKSALLAAQRKMNEDMVKDSSKKMSSAFKLCSFSERIDSMLMWSHYANYHKGFCIEYDIKSIPYGDFRARFLYPVIYSDNMVDATEHILNGIDHEGFNNLYLNKAALVKATDWQYEREWRLLFANGIMDKEQSYCMGKPIALYMGAKIRPEDQGTLVEICKSKNIPYFKMKAHAYQFKVEPTTIEDADQFFFKR